MTCVTCRYRHLLIGMILLAMLGVPLSLSVQGVQAQTRKKNFFVGEKLNENALIYAPQVPQAVGSLILLMGCGGDHWWTLTQWWYLHPAWSPSDQEWCQGSCVFGPADKTAALYLTNNLRIVDAVGVVRLAQDYYGWYNYAWWPDGAPVPEELEDSVARVFLLIEHEYKIVGDYKKIAIAGMSQGADLAVLVGVRFPHQLGMVISERGIVMPPDHVQPGNQSLAAYPGTPFIFTGGDSDEVTSYSTYKASCASLQHMGTPAYFKSFPGLDHGSFSKPEWELLIQLFSLMLNPNPKADQLAHLTWWDSCA